MEENERIYRGFVRNFGNQICNITKGKVYSNLIFLCIGTQRIIGDAFGPLVGTRLTKMFRNARRLNVIGTLENSVVLCNINQIINNIRNNYTNPFIIAIDSALANSSDVGEIFVGDGGIELGACLNRQGVIVGDMSIKGIVGKNCGNTSQNLNVLQNVPLSRIVNLAEIVSTGIYNTINYECNE